MRRFARIVLVVAVAVMPRFLGAQGVPLSRSQAVREAVARSPRSGILLADTSSAFAQLLTARALPNPTLSASYSTSTPMYHLTADLPVDAWWLRGLRVQGA